MHDNDHRFILLFMFSFFYTPLKCLFLSVCVHTLLLD